MKNNYVSKAVHTGVIAAACLLPALASAVTVKAENFQKAESPWDMDFLPDGTMFFTEKCKGLSVRLPSGQVNALLSRSGLFVVKAGMST